METPALAVVPPADLRSPLRRVLASTSLRNSTLLLVIGVVWLFFYFFTDGSFLTPRNLVLLALQTSIVSLAAISAVMLIVTRNFDLSVGSAVALVGVIVALLTVRFDVAAPIAVLAALAAGVLMGAWQGWWVTRMGVSSFIVTLAGMLYFRGISMIATNGATVAPVPASVTSLATGFVSGKIASAMIGLGVVVYGALRIRGAQRARGAAPRPASPIDMFRTLAPVLAGGAVA